MRRLVLLAGLIVLAGCQSLGAGSPRPQATAGGESDPVARLANALPGDYDNHEQVMRAQAADKAGTGIAPMRVQHALRVVDSGRDGFMWLWRLGTVGKTGRSSIWLVRAQLATDGHHVRLVPLRPIDSAAAQTQFAEPARFHYEAAQWAELEPCAQNGEWDGVKFTAAASVEACSALLPGLGQDAAFLPLRLSIDGDMLRVATFADTSRSADAVEEARRVRWYDGWAAINGGGPNAKSDNKDWHLQRDLRLSSEGGRVALHWRDGSPSGYTLEMERTSYPERKLSVLQLNLIDDASGRVMTYVWSDPGVSSIGLNLGWLQAGFGPPETQATAAAK
ncbi:MAG TPA: hypothetical protein VLB69_09780 [Rudaea sp.]|nr:hypothetical protein [Rudaea sp.]